MRAMPCAHTLRVGPRCRLCAKAGAGGFELFAQFEIVADLAVEDNDVPSCDDHGRGLPLMSIMLSPAVSPAGRVELYCATVIWATMGEPLHGKLYGRLFQAFGRGNDAATIPPTVIVSL